MLHVVTTQLHTHVTVILSAGVRLAGLATCLINSMVCSLIL